MRGRERGRAAGAGKVRPWIPREAAAAVGTPCPGLPPGPGGVDAGPHLEQGRAGPDGGGGAGGGAGRRRLLLPQPEAGGGGGGGGEVALKGAGASRVRTGARGRRSRRLRGGRGGAGGRRLLGARTGEEGGSQRQGKAETCAAQLGTVVGLDRSTREGLSVCGRSRGASADLFGEPEGEREAERVGGHTHSALLGKHASSGPDPSVLQLCRLRNQEATEAKANPACPVTPLGMVEAIHNGAGRLGRTVRTGCSHCSVWPQPPPPPPLQQPLGQQEAAAHSAAPTWWWLKTGGGGKTGLERPERSQGEGKHLQQDQEWT